MHVPSHIIVLGAFAFPAEVVVAQKYVYVPCPKGADPDDCPVPRYQPCRPQEEECGPEKERRILTKSEKEARRLQLFGTQPVPKQFEIADPDTPLPYDQPCYSPSRNDFEDSWTKWAANEDASVVLDLSFPFQFFGKTYETTYINDNGFLTFSNTFRDTYQPVSFPSGLTTPMIAPFWADAEVASNGGRGNIWYKDFGDKLAVIWDEVGYYNEFNSVAKAHNSFQVVISKSQDLPDMNNICFCYLDMGWTHGDKDGVNGFEPVARVGQSRAATVGITRGLADPAGTTSYSQIGRFNSSGTAHNGVRVPSGVDWLDFLGSTQILNARTGFCFNSVSNMPPIFKGGPTDGKVTIACGKNLSEYKVYFGAPEFDQTLTLEILEKPALTPTGFSATADGDGTPADTIGLRFEWPSIDFAMYGGKTFDFTFKVCDSVNPPACITQTISFAVATCGNGDPGNCILEKCTSIRDSPCLETVGPKCTPWLSTQHCDAQYSFPMLISSRYPMIKESLYGSSDILGDDGWWFHYTDDRAGAYTFTRDMGEAAPEVLCCVTTVDQLLGTTGTPSSSICFDDTPAFTDPVVIRAEGHHGGTGVFVLPLGLNVSGGPTPELGTGAGTITMEQVRSYLTSLSPTPKKILVEKFIAGSGAGATATLPNEYKFHMFNGRIGSISAFLNPGKPCACYGEYTEDWKCLHKYGCFKDQLPFGKKDGVCYKIDFAPNDDSAKTTTVKGLDFCGPAPAPKTCVFNKMKEIALKLSAKIGVYVRIDMFVTSTNEIYVQEYTFNHLGGTKHCAAKQDASKCVDSCFLGKLWSENGGNPEMGGPLTARPTAFPPTYGSLSDSDQCRVALDQSPLMATPACI